MVETNKKVVCKETIENLTKDWSGGSYLMLRIKPVVPRGRPLISIGCKYNKQKVIYFIVTENSENTQAGLPYLSNYPDQFTNISIRPISCALVMYKFFG